MIYPVDSAIQRLNNRSLGFKKRRLDNYANEGILSTQPHFPKKKADKITHNLISIKGCVLFLWVYCFDVFYPVGTPLYCDRSEYSAEKFGYVVEEVLLPLALDYHVRSRTNEVDAVASAEVTNLNGDTSVFNAAVKV